MSTETEAISYRELLKDPRWQRRRLEIFSLRDFKCEVCGEREKTLAVHHTCYLKDDLTGAWKMPWEYDDCFLRLLCEECHKQAQETMKAFKVFLGILSKEELEEVWVAIEPIVRRAEVRLGWEIEESHDPEVEFP